MSTRRYQILGDIVTGTQLNDKLKNYVPVQDVAELVSWINVSDNKIVVTMKDGQVLEYNVNTSKVFETVEYDKETSYLHFYDTNGVDVYDPVYIESGGGGTASSSVVKLTNQNGTATFTVASGTSLNLMFNFTSTEDDIATGNGTCQITVNGIVKSTFDIVQGLTTVDVTSYLSSGSNTVRVKCTDIYGNYKSLAYTISVIDMYITSTFDVTVPFSGDITYKYTPYGSIEKTIHILLDGTEISSSTVSTSGKQITYIIPAQDHGVHRLEVYATAEVDGVSMESKRLIYDVICTKDGDNTTMIASAFEITSVKQGEQVSIPYIVYDPTKLACDITLDIYAMSSGSEVIYSTQELTVDRSQQFWNTRKYPVGTVYFRIKYGQISKTHTIEVIESDIKVEAETNDLELVLLSDGRSNNEANPATWTYESYSTNFEKFNWKTNGWINDEHGDTCLRLNGDAKAEIKFQPFKDDIRTYGKTIELEFTIRDVNKRDAVVISCLSGGIGFEVTADTACLQSEQSKVFCKYKEDDDDDDVIDKVRIAFVVEARSEYRQLCVYLNGILSKEIQYPDTDNFQQTSPVNITIGSSSCGVDIYSIRSYTTALTSQQINNNRIADIKDIVEKTATYEKNDIYDEYGNVSFEKCVEKNSVMLIIGELPSYKGNKKTVKVVYYDLYDSSLNFADAVVTIDVQGTSSQFYVRKNWKLKCSQEHAIDVMQVLNKVFCIKVDYAEATGKHNTGNANFVHTLYDELIPPQEDNPLTRTTIYGKPILLFQQADENSDPVFYGKCNFNFDKGSLEAFGFTDDYDVESWEFCNNTSDACNFLGSIPSIWVDDFEARYPEDYTDISRFKVMHDWVVSTYQNGATGSALSETYTDANGKTYSIDTAEYRLAKFKTEFEEHFNLHYTLIYYVWTFVALMVDQRAKNMFLTYWGSTGKWYPYFYDNDTSFGINNEGQRIFDYYLEDTDQFEGANVYNGQNSVLWNNVRVSFPDKIKETYQNLRTSGKLTFQKIKYCFIDNHSAKWSEAIYNEDAYFKYIQMLIEDGDATNLYQIRGDAEEDFEYFVKNRLDFCDSKWYAGDYVSNYVSLRIYTPSEWSAIEPNADITPTYFSTIYAGVRYKANGTLYQEKVSAGVPITFNAPDETFNDTETAIYGAHLVSSLGDLAPLYAGSINVSAADKLIELKVGDSTEGYSNTNLKELSVGTNKLMRKVNVCNCPNFASVLDLSGCPSMEEVYATGSGITGVNFPEAGILRIAHLPATITNFTLKHQLYIETLAFEGYDNIKTLWVENCPTIDTLDILDKCVNIERVRLTNVNWSYPDTSVLYELIDRNIAGIDENGTNIDYMWIDGTCHISTLTGAEYLYIKEAFPYMTITYDTLTAELIFMSEDGSTELARQTIQNGGNGTDPVTAGTISTPTKTSTAQYNYTYSGWSLTSGGSANSNALKNVEADRKVYVAFTATVRTYTVKFYNGTALLQTVTNVPYGSTATYTGKTPTNTSTGNTADFEFYGWSPSPTNIQGNTNCYAQFHDLREITDSWATIAAAVADGTATEKYAIGAFKMLDIGVKDLPYNFDSGSAVVLNGEIHILGSASSEYRKYHYKWAGTEWVEVGVIPYEFYYGSAVVYNNEIHILGGSSSSSGRTKHYKWDGSSWTSVSTLPYKFSKGIAIVYNNEIHIMGSNNGSNYTSHYKWNGSAWSEVGNLPYSFYTASGFIYNNEIHVLGSYDSNYETAHYKYDGSSWTSVSTLPQKLSNGHALVVGTDIYMIQWDEFYKYDGTSWSTVPEVPANVYEGCSVVLDGVIYVMGSSVSGNEKVFFSYTPETETWSKVGITESIPMEVIAHNHDELAADQTWKALSPLPYNFYTGSAVILNNEIHILGGQGDHDAHYKWNGTNWVSVSTLPYRFYRSVAVVYNDEIHILGTDYSRSTYGVCHYKWTGTEWVSVSTLPYIFYYGGVVVYNDEIHIMGSGESAHNTKHYKWTGTEWVSVSTLPYACYESSVIVYNNEIHLLGGTYSSDERTNHYKWNGTEWTSVSTLPVQFWEGAAVIFNNDIHIIGGYGDDTAHYKWNGTEWTSVSTLPFEFYYGCGVVYNNKITLLGSQVTAYRTTFTQLVGASWVNAGTIPISVNAYGQILVYNDEIHSLARSTHGVYDGSTASSSTLPFETPAWANFVQYFASVYNNEIHYIGAGTRHYKFDGVEWTEASTLPVSYDLNNTIIIAFDSKLHLIQKSTHYSWDGTEWTEDVVLPISIGQASPVVYNNELHIVSGTRHYKFDGTTWSSVSTLPLSTCATGITVYNNEIYISGARPNIGAGMVGKMYSWNGSEWIERTISNNNVLITTYRGHLCMRSGSTIIRLEKPRATLTFLAKNALTKSRQINSGDKTYNGNTNYTAGGWALTDIRKWCNETFINDLPTDLQNHIKSVKKFHDCGYADLNIVSSEDKIWLCSVDELGGELTYCLKGQGYAYSVFTDNNSRIRTTDNKDWWTRSTATSNQNVWVKVNGNGAFATHGGMESKRIIIGLCI